MISEIKKHLEIVAKFNSSNEKEIESFRIYYIGRKGVLKTFFNEFSLCHILDMMWSGKTTS